MENDFGVKSPISTMGEEHLLNIRWKRGPGFYEAVMEEVQIALKAKKFISMHDIMAIEDMVKNHYEIDVQDFDERYKMNLEYNLSDKAARQLAKRHAKRKFSPKFELLKETDNARNTANA